MSNYVTLELDPIIFESSNQNNVDNKLNEVENMQYFGMRKFNLI